MGVFVIRWSITLPEGQSRQRHHPAPLANMNTLNNSEKEIIFDFCLKTRGKIFYCFGKMSGNGKTESK